MKMAYTFIIVKRLIFSGRLVTALWICCRVLRGKLLGGNYRCIYALMGSNIRNVCRDQLRDYEINHFDSWSKLTTTDRKELIQYRGSDFKGTQKLFNEGGCLWVGRLQGKIINFGWSRWGATVNAWFFPLSPKWVILSHFETLTVQRGKGLYAILLSHIINELDKQGVEIFIIDCADWNLPSIRGIEKLGFRLIGHGVHRWRKYLSYYHRPKQGFNFFPSD